MFQAFATSFSNTEECISKYVVFTDHDKALPATENKNSAKENFSIIFLFHLIKVSLHRLKPMAPSSQAETSKERVM